GRLWIIQVHLGREEKRSLRLESSAQVLDDEDVTVARELAKACGHLLIRTAGHTVRRAPEENRQRSALIYRSKDHGLQVHTVAHGDHHFLVGERGTGCRALRRQRSARSAQ